VVKYNWGTGDKSYKCKIYFLCYNFEGIKRNQLELVRKRLKSRFWKITQLLDLNRRFSIKLGGILKVWW